MVFIFQDPQHIVIGQTVPGGIGFNDLSCYRIIAVKATMIEPDPDVSIVVFP
ncbi:hypothetical protein D3C86_1974040 [compost metagenome]